MKSLFTALTTLALALGVSAVHAEDMKKDEMGMKKESSMQKDGMAKDHMKKDSMGKDRMKKDSMGKDEMKKDSMGKDAMGKDEMKK